ncbi:hypothetical protein CPB86DRAFT_726266 [Serendipita vermifera]|nr:hypothetical protein CPB86DRAFT_726266 [Serendipita vermifera]
MLARRLSRSSLHITRSFRICDTRANSSITSDAQSKSQKPYYVTSPIFYVNAAPHIGHLYSMVIADILARWEIMKNPFRDVYYTTGTDEHGLKIQQAAKLEGIPPLQLADYTSERFRNLATAAGLVSTTFIRTTEERHAKSVEDIWRRLVQKGYIYKGVHEGWYAVSDEAFYTAKEVEEVADPSTGIVSYRSIETGKNVVWTQEENYKFRLSEFREPLTQWIQEHSPIYPKKRQEEILHFISDKTSLQDLSVSRPRNRVEWGLPVPNEPSHTIYVWLDALSSYMTAVGHPWANEQAMKAGGWPADVHVVGKDISRFHAIYFPAFLMALDIPLPRSILCHAHWTMNRQKMSKSVGNVVDPFQILERYGGDSVRWYLATLGGHFMDDVDWSLEQLEILHNRDLRGIGNLYKRLHGKSLCSETRVALPSLSSKHSIEAELVESLMTVSRDVTESMKAQEVSRAIEQIMNRIDLTNRYLSQREPWRAPPSTSRDGSIALARESLRICSTLLQPFLPGKMPILLDWLRVPAGMRSLTWATFGAFQSVGGYVATPEQKLFEGI